MIEILPETENGYPDLEQVLDRAFGPGRHAKTSERVRENGAAFQPALSRVALMDGAAIGCCRIWRVAIGEAEALFLGPLAVEPDCQHHGVGADLVRASVEAARATPYPAILLVGAASFFAPLGFREVPRGRVLMPGPVDPGRFLGFSLRDGGLESLAGAVSAPRGASPASEG